MNGEDDKPAEPFDARAASAQVPAAEAVLLAQAKARRGAAAAQTSREFAVESLRSLEPIIVELFDAGTQPLAVLNILRQHIPAVAPGDLSYALALVRERYRMSKAPTPARPAATPSAPKQNSAAPAPNRAAPKVARPTPDSAVQGQAVVRPPTATPALELPPWADGSDRLPDEPEDQYILRKNLEGDPKERRKFIGEHNA